MGTLLMATLNELRANWVHNGVTVVARWGTPDVVGSEGAGKVIGYCDAPQVLIEREDGSTFWWRADLCKEES